MACRTRKSSQNNVEKTSNPTTFARVEFLAALLTDTLLIFCSVFLPNFALRALIEQFDNGVFEEVPVCSITTEPFQDPVIIETGHTYERAAIEEWWDSERTCPNSGVTVKSTSMIPNRNVRDAILWIQTEQERARGF